MRPIILLTKVVIAFALLSSFAEAQELDDLSAWKNVLSFRPPSATQEKVKSKGPNWGIHQIEKAKGQVSLDIYSVEIKQFPKLDGKQFEPSQLVDYVRRNINQFVDTDICSFKPFDETEKSLWESSKPDSSIVLIDMKKFGLSPDSGCVVTTVTSTNEWMFSTLQSGHPLAALAGDEAAAHPVSGNRAFGIYKLADGRHVFYTVAADRPTLWIDDQLADNVVFPSADQLWKSLQGKLVAFINDNGGKAKIKSTNSRRFDWKKVEASKYYDTSNQPSWK